MGKMSLLGEVLVILGLLFHILARLSSGNNLEGMRLQILLYKFSVGFSLIGIILLVVLWFL